MAEMVQLEGMVVAPVPTPSWPVVAGFQVVTAKAGMVEASSTEMMAVPPTAAACKAAAARMVVLAAAVVESDEVPTVAARLGMVFAVRQV